MIDIGVDVENEQLLDDVSKQICNLAKGIVGVTSAEEVDSDVNDSDDE